MFINIMIKQTNNQTIQVKQKNVIKIRNLAKFKKNVF